MSNLDLLKKLRDITGAGMMDCKKYLDKSNNDLDAAVKLMRSEGGVKADKKSSRIAADGLVNYISNSEKALLIEVNSETDFVARSDDFKNYVDDVCQIILETNYKNISELEKDKEVFDKLEDIRNNIITKLGENIIIRRFKVIDNRDVYISGYTHNGKIGAFVVLESEDPDIAKDICMQIVASNPLALDESSIDQAILDNEKDIYKAELDKIDKKDDIKRNILEGKIKKFITENTLINQPYIKDGSLTLKKILKNNKIIDYTRYQLGEGIEKKSDDFAEEVYSQIK
jgi:elongation factor Ts